MLVLASMKQLVWADKGVRDGTAWAVRSNLSLGELEGSTVGIIGIGFLGSEIARKLKYGFRCHVLGYDPYADKRLTSLADVEMVPDLYDLLRQSRVLILAPALTDETRNMIGKTELATLPKDAIVVNSAGVRCSIWTRDWRLGKRARAQLASTSSTGAATKRAFPALEPEGDLHSAYRRRHNRGDISARAICRRADQRMPKGKDAEVCGKSGGVDRASFNATT